MAENPFSMGASSGQAFTRRGRPGSQPQTFARDVTNDWQGAIEDMAAMSERLAVIGQGTAIQLANALTNRTKEAIRTMMPPHGWIPPEERNTGAAFEFSKGRLAAAWGYYTPDDMRGEVDENNQTPIEILHEKWCADNGVVGQPSIEGASTGEELIVEMGAITDIKRNRASAWTVEVGTFLPYAPLANDGGTMMIHPYGNPELTVQAHWEGVHFMEMGVAAAEADVEVILEGSINAALEGTPGRRTRDRG